MKKVRVSDLIIHISDIYRHRFNTNLFKRGMNLEDIALFSGHSAIRILKLYIKLTPEEKVDEFPGVFSVKVGGDKVDIC
jgi:site-specific recombinase XerD